MYDLATTDLSVVERTVIERALPSTLPPLTLNRPQRVQDIFLAGDYLQTPSIQGALVSGRRAAQLILKTLV
jgi:predicted NAD/FAD-dependent oxidoreductase